MIKQYQIEEYVIESHSNHSRNIKEFEKLCEVVFTSYDIYDCEEIPKNLLTEEDLVKLYIDKDISKGRVKSYQIIEDDDVSIIGYELI